MVAWMAALTSWRLRGTMCMPRELKTTLGKVASDLQIPRHDLAHFCCAKLRHSTFRPFLILPSLSHPFETGHWQNDPSPAVGT